MRTIKIIFMAIVAIGLAIVGFANRQVVTLTLFPAELTPFTRYNLEVTVKLYVVVFGSIAVGLFLGFVWEWMREHKHRSEAVSQRREKALLAREVQKLKADRPEGKDEILALLEDSKRTS